MADATLAAAAFNGLMQDSSNLNRLSMASTIPAPSSENLKKYIQYNAQEADKTKMMPTLFSSQYVNNYKNRSNNNGQQTPDYQAGIAETMLPGENKSLALPNAFLQRLEYEQNVVRPGQFSAVDWLTNNKAGQGQYVSRDVLRDYLNTQVAPNYQGSGSFNRANQLAIDSEKLKNQQAANLQRTGGAFTEQRNTQGAITGKDTAMRMGDQINALNQQQQGYNNNMEVVRAAGKRSGLDSLFDAIEKRKATTSNLPITEKLIK